MSTASPLVNTPSILYYTLCRYAHVTKHTELERLLKLMPVEKNAVADSLSEKDTASVTAFMDVVEKRSFAMLLKHDDPSTPPATLQTILYEQLIRPLFTLCVNYLSSPAATKSSDTVVAAEVNLIIRCCAYRLEHSRLGTYIHLYGGWNAVFHEEEVAAAANTTTAVPPASDALLMLSSQSLLSDAHILAHMAHGNIVIHPFRPSFLSTTSYDVTLGPYYYSAPGNVSYTSQEKKAYYNMYDDSQVKSVWGPLQEASVLGESMKLVNVAPTDRIIWIGPGQTFLCHTNEFIGGMHCINTMMKARSSFGRNFLSVCKCAGWGDIGYVNRWTMEITNHSMRFFIPLVVGRRIAQIVFFQTNNTIGRRQYRSKYQHTSDVASVMERWAPEQMLPRLHMDVPASSTSSSVSNA